MRSGAHNRDFGYRETLIFKPREFHHGGWCITIRCQVNFPGRDGQLSPHLGVDRRRQLPHPCDGIKAVDDIADFYGNVPLGQGEFHDVADQQRAGRGKVGQLGIVVLGILRGALIKIDPTEHAGAEVNRPLNRGGDGVSHHRLDAGTPTGERNRSTKGCSHRNGLDVVQAGAGIDGPGNQVALGLKGKALLGWQVGSGSVIDRDGDAVINAIVILRSSDAPREACGVEGGTEGATIGLGLGDLAVTGGRDDQITAGDQGAAMGFGGDGIGAAGEVESA